MLKVVCLLSLAVCLPCGVLTSKYTDSIMTKVASAKGELLCGKAPLKGAHVWLFRNNTNSDDDILDYVLTGDDGSFALEGNTAGRPSENMGIKPRLKIYHKCDHTKDTYRAFHYNFNETYVSLGRISRRNFDLGKVNLQIEYPGETVEKKLYEGRPKKFSS